MDAMGVGWVVGWFFVGGWFLLESWCTPPSNSEQKTYGGLDGEG